MCNSQNPLYVLRGAIESNKLVNAPQVAVIIASEEIIEVIVRLAEEKSGIEMDWSYSGNSGIIVSNGNREKCRETLRSLLPVTDLTAKDWEYKW